MTKNEKQEKKIFKSFSRNLNAFLKKEGIFPIKKGVHTTGVQISPDGGMTWEDYTSIVQALDKYYKVFSREDLEGLIKESFKHSSPVFGVEYKGNDIMVCKRVRYYQEYEINDRLQVALKRWKESGPKK